jgi:cell wall-associated NlpC family hydrolase/regulator of replication initiation timing
VLLAAAAVCAASLLWSTVGAFAAIPADLQDVNLYGNVKAQVDDLTAQANQIQTDIERLDAELEGYTESFNELQLRLTDVNTKMSELRRELGAAERDHAYRLRKFEDRLIALYKSGGDTEELFVVLLDAHGLGDLVNRIRLIATLADQDQRLVDNLSESTDRLDTLLAQIDDAKAEELTIRNQIEDQQERIETALADRQKTLTGLDSEITAIIQKERQRQEQEQARLRQALVAMLNGGQIYTGPLPQTSAEIINQFLETAAFYMGIPYVWAGDRCATGFDCSGYVAYVYRQHGVELPHYSGFQAQLGHPVSIDQIQAGDLVAFGFPVHHVGIYVGGGMFIHAPRTGDVIKISQLSERTDLAAIRRFELQPRIGAPAVW